MDTLTVDTVTLETVTVDIQVIRVGKRQMTQAVFRQLPMDIPGNYWDLITNNYVSDGYTLWGLINFEDYWCAAKVRKYNPPAQQWVIFSSNGKLFRFPLLRDYTIFLGTVPHNGGSLNFEERNILERALDKFVYCLDGKLPQLFIAV